jgi:hypothetical protein
MIDFVFSLEFMFGFVAGMMSTCAAFVTGTVLRWNGVADDYPELEDADPPYRRKDYR